MNNEAAWTMIRDHIDHLNVLFAQLQTTDTQRALMRQVSQALRELEQLAPFLPSGQLTSMLFYPHEYGLPATPTGEEIASKACGYRPLITPAPSPENPLAGQGKGGEERFD